MIDKKECKKIETLSSEGTPNGWLLEVLSEKDHISKHLNGQIYLTVAEPGEFKGFHAHAGADYYITCIKGKIIETICSKHRDRETFEMGEECFLTVHLPKGMPHGFVNIGEEPAYVIIYRDKPYDPEDKEQFDIGLEEIRQPELWEKLQKFLDNYKPKGKVMKPKEWWGNQENASKWLRRARLYDAHGSKSLEFIPKTIAEAGFKSVLEVGSGDGRLIGKLHKDNSKIICGGADVNPKLAGYVHGKHDVKTSVGEFVDLPIKDNEFELVYTYQCLQHAHPKDVQKAVDELQRIASKEVWLFEGWHEKAKHGRLRHKGSGGTWYWDFSKLANCYSVEKSEERFGSAGMRWYKIKK